MDNARHGAIVKSFSVCTIIVMGGVVSLLGVLLWSSVYAGLAGCAMWILGWGLLGGGSTSVDVLDIDFCVREERSASASN